MPKEESEIPQTHDIDRQSLAAETVPLFGQMNRASLKWKSRPLYPQTELAARTEELKCISTLQSQGRVLALRQKLSIFLLPWREKGMAKS